MPPGYGAGRSEEDCFWLDEACVRGALGIPLRGTSVSEPPRTSSRGSPALCVRWKQLYSGAA
jgi:hypothetical protein